MSDAGVMQAKSQPDLALLATQAAAAVKNVIPQSKAEVQETLRW